MQRKRGTEELISKDKQGLGGGGGGGTVIYELNSMRKINTQFIIFYAEIAQIRNKELYKQSFQSSSGYSSNSVHVAKRLQQAPTVAQ